MKTMYDTFIEDVWQSCMGLNEERRFDWLVLLTRNHDLIIALWNPIGEPTNYINFSLLFIRGKGKGKKRKEKKRKKGRKGKEKLGDGETK